MDLIDLYLRHEPGGARLLLDQIERHAASGRLKAFSNLCNFTVDFDH